MAVGLLVLGCSGGSDGDGGPTTSTGASADAESDGGADADSDSDGTTSDAPSDERAPVVQSPIEVVQLGFTVDRFEVPRPGPRPDEGVLLDRDDGGEPTGDEPAVDAAEIAAFDALAFDDGQDLLDIGIEAGTWTEVEGLRAILSVLLGELPADAIGGFDELRRASHGRLLERVVEVLDDPAVDAAERADLARLASFFLDDEFPGIPAEEWDPGRPTGLRRVEQQGSGCQQVEESSIFRAPDTRVCYVTYRNESGDIVYAPTSEAPSVDDAEAVFAMIEVAREGYRRLADTELPRVWVLISTREVPNSTAEPDKLIAGHAFGGGYGGVCKVALFATRATLTNLEIDLLTAHELFHCVQNVWAGSLDGMTTEGGAEYFAYKLVGECGSLPGWGPGLDNHTIDQSLLALEYPGWFFWAFLEDSGLLSVEEIAVLHRRIAAGLPVDRAVDSAVDDLPSALNEFYVRLMGPGLTCGYSGDRVTSTIDVSETGPVELQQALWHGFRYKLEYAAGTHFEQRDQGAGPIGMAKAKETDSEGAWVVLAPDIRPECDEAEKWIVVPTSESGDSPEEREIEVFTADDANCDPCLLGTWQIDLKSMEALWRSLGAGDLPANATFGISGSWAMDFSSDPEGDTTFEERRDVVIAATLNDSTVALDLDGNGIGSFTSSGESANLTDISDTGEATLGGITESSSSSTDSFSFTYICDRNALSFQVQGQTLQADRVPPIPEGDPYF